jgi:RNA recognition motif-containing protein
VRFVREEDMLAAIDGLNDTEYNGRTLTVRKDRYQE